ncbi:hypothetical protein ACWOBH_06225 [Globicatella sanguinis]
MARIAWDKFKPVQIAQNYNDGVVKFYEKEPKVDEYNTPIRGQYQETETYRDWFRRLGVTVQDVYFSNADAMKVTEKVAIRGNVTIDSKWSAKINGKSYEVYRSYYNGKESETEISLAEV